MRLVSVVLAVAAAASGFSEVASDEVCLHTFRSCEAACPALARSEFAMHRSAPYEVRLRLCVKTCAKESALCQDEGEVAVDSATIGSGNNPWSSFNDALGRPTLPFGFYQYSIADARNFRLPEEESVHGMSLSAPYVSTAAPTEQWFQDMQAFLDRCHAVGFKVNYQLIAFEKLGNDAATLANLTAQINRFKDHPAILAWYLADEPGGQGIPPATLKAKYEAIKAADKTKPVSMVFCTQQAKSYLDVLDLIMVDPYPIPGGAASSVLGSLSNVASLGKPIMMVPQAFGGGENWARAPSAQEERLMTYLGLMSGAVAIQYFVRSPEAGFPYAPAAWSEIRKVAAETRVLTPAILGGKPVAVKAAVAAATAQCTLETKGWSDRDGSILVIVANLENNDGPACQFSVSIDGSASPPPGQGDIIVSSLFENRMIAANVSAPSFAFADSLRGLGVGVYRVERVRTTRSSLIYNPSFETCVNPGIPDGNYVGEPIDQGGYFSAEFRDSVDGRTSLHLHAPSSNNGTSMSPYTIPRVNASATYTFKVSVRGTAEGGETVVFKFNDAIFKVATAPNSLTAVAPAGGKWQLFSVKLVATADPSSACPYNCRSWMSYSLVTAGDAWVDAMSLEADD